MGSTGFVLCLIPRQLLQTMPLPGAPARPRAPGHMCSPDALVHVALKTLPPCLGPWWVPVAPSAAPGPTHGTCIAEHPGPTLAGAVLLPTDHPFERMGRLGSGFMEQEECLLQAPLEFTAS